MSGSASTTTDESASTRPTATASAPRVRAGLPGSGANELDPIPRSAAQPGFGFGRGDLGEAGPRVVGPAQRERPHRPRTPPTARGQGGAGGPHRDLRGP